MDKLLNLFVSIVSQPSILVSLIALLGLVLQKKKFSEVIQGTIKTFVRIPSTDRRCWFNQ